MLWIQRGILPPVQVCVIYLFKLELSPFPKSISQKQLTYTLFFFYQKTTIMTTIVIWQLLLCKRKLGQNTIIIIKARSRTWLSQSWHLTVYQRKYCELFISIECISGACFNTWITFESTHVEPRCELNSYLHKKTK